MSNETMTMKVKERRELKQMQEELAAEIEASRRAAGPPLFPTCALNVRQGKTGAYKWE